VTKGNLLESNHWLKLSLITVVLILHCAPTVVVSPPPPIQEYPRMTPVPKSPLIRVGLMKGISVLEYSANSSFEMVPKSGGRAIPCRSGDRWRAELLQSKPGKSAFRLLLFRSPDRSDALMQADRFRRAGYTVHQEVSDPSPLIRGAGSREYRVFLQEWFETWDEARTVQKARWPDSDTHIVRNIQSPGNGRFRLTNTRTGEIQESEQPVILQGADITLHDVPVGVGFHWETHETRTYPGKIELTFDIDGQLAVVNIVSLENYLKGVVPSEMSEGFPLEALKAQAVAARGKVMGNWGIGHVSDPFDVCADVHCQVYSGLSKRSPKTDYAVDKTSGLFIMQGDKICDAIFGAVCGGHTEDVEKAWGGEQVDYLRGRIDGSPWLNRYGSLQNEDNVKRWIDDSPDAFCNTRRIKVPDCLQYTVKYFRWETRLSQTALQQSIEAYTKEQVGQIRELNPLARGVSGRIIQLEVAGTRKTIIIKGELNIRKALSATTLWSACFYVKKEGWASPPEYFILKGAGFGHGVGMCQTGAAMMALRGRKFHHILKHYYKGVRISKLY
jgi:stage II sporulation protein D